MPLAFEKHRTIFRLLDFSGDSLPAWKWNMVQAGPDEPCNERRCGGERPARIPGRFGELESGRWSLSLAGMVAYVESEQRMAATNCKTMTITHTITRERTVATGLLGIATIDTEEEIEVDCEVKMWRGMKGARDSFGVPLEPDDEPEAEIESVTPEIDLTEGEQEAIREKAFDQAADEASDFEE